MSFPQQSTTTVHDGATTTETLLRRIDDIIAYSQLRMGAVQDSLERTLRVLERNRKRANHLSMEIRRIEKKLENAAAAGVGKDCCCRLCFKEIGGGRVKIKLDCGHVFHGSCLGSWITNTTSDSCPSCRRRRIASD